MNGNLKGIAYRVQVAGTGMVNRVMDKLITIGLFTYVEGTKLNQSDIFSKKITHFFTSDFDLLPSRSNI